MDVDFFFASTKMVMWVFPFLLLFQLITVTDFLLLKKVCKQLLTECIHIDQFTQWFGLLFLTEEKGWD